MCGVMEMAQGIYFLFNSVTRFALYMTLFRSFRSNTLINSSSLQYED